MVHVLNLSAGWKNAISPVFSWLLIFCSGILANAQEPQLEPRVSRVQMRLSFSEDEVDVIEKGDVLTVIEDREDGYLIRTFSGRKGLVAKVNAVELAESMDIYSELIEAGNDEGRLYTLRAGAWWAANKNDEALADFDKAIELGYDAAHAFMSRGLFYASQGNQEKAIEDYSKAIEKDPKDNAPRINRAASYVMLGKHDLAIDDYSKTIENQPSNAVLYQQRAVAYKALGKTDEAIADFGKAIEAAGSKKPECIPAQMSRGYLYFQLNKHEEAIEDFAAVIQINPQAAVAYNNRGYNLFQLGKAVDALRDYDEAIKLEPKYGLAHQNRAWLLATTDNKKIRDSKAAIESATIACELSEYQDLSDMAALAAATAANEEFDKAIGLQERVIEKAAPAQKPFAEKILELYQNHQPFDPKVAEKLSADADKMAEQTQPSETPKLPPEPVKKRAL
ncbi:MAG: tetratricopeptide repeat protein [Pirellulaceae bacterium]|nr:tetratricopeptide repeat protein [Pirellulaceae bacterium]